MHPGGFACLHLLYRAKQFFANAFFGVDLMNSRFECSSRSSAYRRRMCSGESSRPQSPVDSRDQRQQRGTDDIRVLADTKERRTGRCRYFDVGDGGRIAAAAAGVFVVSDDIDRETERTDRRIDWARATLVKEDGRTVIEELQGDSLAVSSVPRGRELMRAIHQRKPWCEVLGFEQLPKLLRWQLLHASLGLRPRMSRDDTAPSR